MSEYSAELTNIVAAIELKTGISAKWTSQGARVSNPTTGSTDRNVGIKDGDKRVIVYDFANRTDPKDILEAAGLPITDIYYEKFSPQQKAEHKTKVSKKTLLDEIDHELLIMTLWVSDLRAGLYPRIEADRKTTRDAFDRLRKVMGHMEAEL